MSVSVGTLDPPFAPTTFSYSFTVPFSTSSVTFDAIPTDEFSSIVISRQNNDLTSISSSFLLQTVTVINLDVGVNIITIVVTSDDGTTVTTYTFTVIRLSSGIITYSSILYPNT